MLSDVAIRTRAEADLRELSSSLKSELTENKNAFTHFERLQLSKLAHSATRAADVLEKVTIRRIRESKADARG